MCFSKLVLFTFKVLNSKDGGVHQDRNNANLTGNQQPVVEETVGSMKIEMGKKQKSDKTGKLKGKKDMSPNKSEDKKKRKSIKSKSSVSPQKITDFVTCDGHLSENSSEDEIMYDTSKLTVAEYYEMLQHSQGADRDQFLRNKLNHQSILRTILNIENIESTQRKPKEEPLMSNFYVIGTLKTNQVRVVTNMLNNL